MQRGILALNSSRTAKLSELIFGIGLLTAVVGVGKYFLNFNFPIKQSTANPNSITERRLSIDSAVRKGNSIYGFSTNFIPGIGTITDPQAFIRDWEQQNAPDDSAAE